LSLAEMDREIGKIVQLRQFQLNDLEQVLMIERQSFRTPWSREMFLKELELDFAYNRVAELKKDKGIAGYIFCWLVLTEATVLSLAVREDLRRQGLALYILETAFDDFKHKGIKEVWLEVRQTNVPARALYTRLGFEQVGIRPKYYYDSNEDAIVMRKALE